MEPNLQLRLAKIDAPPVARVVARPSDEALARLRERGPLTRLTGTGWLERIVHRLHGRAAGPPSYVLMPSCHLRADPSHAQLALTMGKKRVDQVLARLAQIDAAHWVPPGVPRSLTLFGGDPLARVRRPVVQYILERARLGAGLTVNAVSNATELDAFADLLGPRPGKIAGLQVTLAGPPEEHDPRIAHSVSMALQRGTAVTARIQLDRCEVRRLPEIAAELERRGWDTRDGFSAYVAPIEGVDLSRAVGELAHQFPAMNILDAARGAFAPQRTLYVIDALADLYVG